MSNLAKNIEICVKNRELVGGLISKALVNNPHCSEILLHDELKVAIGQQAKFHPQGWYDPPPDGIGVLFANPEDNYERSRFPTLRIDPYWPSVKNTMSEETVGMVYVSPVDKNSGVISDIGLNFYMGSNPKLQEHLSYCLEAIEDIAEQAKVGMSFKRLHELGQEILEKRDVHNGWMVTYNDPTRAANFGHTFPWTFKEPTAEELLLIQGEDFGKLKDVISGNRLFINTVEEFIIPETIAFSIEARLGSNRNPDLPGGYYYMLVTFLDGIKKVHTHLNPIFEALNMNYIRSRFE